MVYALHVKRSSSLFQQSTTAELKALPSFPFTNSVSLCWKAVEPKPNHSMIRLGFFSRRLAKPCSGCKPFHTYKLMSIQCLPFVLSSFHTCTSHQSSLTSVWCRPSQCLTQMNFPKARSCRTPFREHSSILPWLSISRSTSHSSP